LLEEIELWYSDFGFSSEVEEIEYKLNTLHLSYNPLVGRISNHKETNKAINDLLKLTEKIKLTKQKILEQKPWTSSYYTFNMLPVLHNITEWIEGIQKKQADNSLMEVYK